jgi:proline iminopeptidase
VNEHFYPPIDPFDHGTLAVDDVHTLYYEQCGGPDGEPIVFLHGGPGVGCTSADRRFFDPEHFRIVLLDQRGSGRSKPLGELKDNDVDHVAADVETLREHLGIDTWHVFGGSWGSTLALFYAETYPASCRSLVLRGIWLLRQAEIDWWLYGIRWFRPELWQTFAEHLPESERDDLLEGYWKRLTSEDRDVALAAARCWSVYEGSSCTLLPNPEFEQAFGEDDVAYSVARLEAHYFRNVRFPRDELLLDQIDRIRDIPSFAVHGRYDLVCPVRNLLDLKHAWAELEVEIVPAAGHSSHEPGITKALVAATNRIRDRGRP